MGNNRLLCSSKQVCNNRFNTLVFMVKRSGGGADGNNSGLSSGVVHRLEAFDVPRPSYLRGRLKLLTAAESCRYCWPFVDTGSRSNQS